MTDQPLRRLTNAEVTPDMTASAVAILHAHYKEPLGSRFAFLSAGHDYVAVLERHWDEKRGPHVGVSLFAPIVPPVVVDPPGRKPLFWLGRTSLKHLAGVDQRLVDVMKRAITLTKIDFTVIEGLRSKERQAQLVAEGKSQTMNSRHLTGHAVDVAPWVNGTVSWLWPDFRQLAPFIQAAALELSIPLEWGRNWPTFPDGPHWQIPWGK